jgi:hypothetical protein
MSNRLLRIVYPAAIDSWPRTRRFILPASPAFLPPSLHSLPDSRVQTSRGFSQFGVALSQVRDLSVEKVAERGVEEAREKYGEKGVEDETGEDDDESLDTGQRYWRTTNDYKRAGPPIFEEDDESLPQFNYPPSKTIRMRRFPRYVDDVEVDKFLSPYVGVVEYRS